MGYIYKEVVVMNLKHRERIGGADVFVAKSNFCVRKPYLGLEVAL